MCFRRCTSDFITEDNKFGYQIFGVLILCQTLQKYMFYCIGLMVPPLIVRLLNHSEDLTSVQ